QGHQRHQDGSLSWSCMYQLSRAQVHPPLSRSQPPRECQLPDGQERTLLGPAPVRRLMTLALETFARCPDKNSHSRLEVELRLKNIPLFNHRPSLKAVSARNSCCQVRACVRDSWSSS